MFKKYEKMLFSLLGHFLHPVISFLQSLTIESKRFEIQEQTLVKNFQNIFEVLLLELIKIEYVFDKLEMSAKVV